MRKEKENTPQDPKDHRIRELVMTKCLAGQPNTVEKAQMVFMLWVELEAVDAFLDAMEKAVTSQVARAVLLAIDFMIQVLRIGKKLSVPGNLFWGKKTPLPNHQDQNVLASSKGLTLELCRWVGMNPIKSVMPEKMSDTMVLVIVFLRASHLSAPKLCGFLSLLINGTCSGPSEESAAETPLGKDEYELVDPVDILTPLKKSGFWNKVVIARALHSMEVGLLDMPLEKLDDVRRKKLSERTIGFSGGGAMKHGIMKHGVSRGRFPKANMARGMKADGPGQNKLVEDKDPSEMTQLKNAAGKRPLEGVNLFLPHGGKVLVMIAPQIRHFFKCPSATEATVFKGHVSKIWKNLRKSHIDLCQEALTVHLSTIVYAEINQLQKLSLSDPREQKQDDDRCGEVWHTAITLTLYSRCNQFLKSFPPWWDGVNRKKNCPCFEHISSEDLMPAEWCTTCGLLDDSCRCKRYARLPNMEELPPSLLSPSLRIEIPPFKL
ncbi:hypothetical protein Tco_1097692 [Tanacetum coccineum]